MPEYKEVKHVTGKGYEVKKSGYLNGCDTYYYKDGKLHREDGPAEVISNAMELKKCWFLNGMLHRLDGPAATRNTGDSVHNNYEEEFWINGVQVEWDTMCKVNTSPIEELPLYINTPYEPLVKRRLESV